MWTQCGTGTFINRYRDENRSTAAPMFCGNLRKCERCRMRRVNEILAQLYKVIEPTETIFTGYTTADKASDVARSIQRAGGWYIHAKQNDRVVFLTDTPRRIKGSCKIGATREALSEMLNSLIASMPVGARCITSLPETPEKGNGTKPDETTRTRQPVNAVKRVYENNGGKVTKDSKYVAVSATEDIHRKTIEMLQTPEPPPMDDIPDLPIDYEWAYLDDDIGVIDA